MKLSGILNDSIVDGPGFRMTIFFQGCPHHCEGCHNPETWNYDDFKEEKTVDEILELFDSNPLLSGITLSGGEPFSERNLPEILELVKAIKKRRKDVWAFTGYEFADLENKFKEFSELKEYIDVIVDGPFIKEERDLSLKYRGSSNQKIINLIKMKD